ncbi:MAG TPA: ribonuclease P protein component 4 [Methanoregulaceae archaeon]|nr:ribonuclease P protein component 4 [Methanoregulaceae archaeon]HPD74576.1 ribonuclease P protein component 4 [Methanoregulaceae archaeon]HRY74848.1 ribonuclease P protein component 4 [Methanoregulaceae archaeon]
MRERSKTPLSRKIAKERIDRLFSQAQAVFASHPRLSDRYVEIARKIAMRQRVRISRVFRRKFCRRCSSYLVPGKTSRVRIRSGRVVVTCLVCKARRRYPVGGDTDGKE